MRLYFPVKLKGQNTVILSLDIKYSIRELIYEVSYCSRPANLRYAEVKVAYVYFFSVPFGSVAVHSRSPLHLIETTCLAVATC